MNIPTGFPADKTIDRLRFEALSNPELIGEVLNVMKKVAKDGMTMLVVTHEMGFAREVADRVLVMAEGEIIEDSNPEDLFSQPKDPRTKALIDRYRTGEK